MKQWIGLCSVNCKGVKRGFCGMFYVLAYVTKLKNTKLRGLSPQVNFIYRATAACRRSKCKLLWVKGVAWSAQRIPTAVNLGFLDRSRCFSIQVAPQLSSRG
jgi:hypothetical protein